MRESFILCEAAFFHVVCAVEFHGEAEGWWEQVSRLVNKAAQELHAFVGRPAVVVFSAVCMRAEKFGEKEAMSWGRSQCCACCDEENTVTNLREAVYRRIQRL